MYACQLLLPWCLSNPAPPSIISLTNIKGLHDLEQSLEEGFLHDFLISFDIPEQMDNNLPTLSFASSHSGLEHQEAKLKYFM